MVRSKVRRGGAPGTATTVTADWTFTTRTAPVGPAPLLLSVVRFSPALRRDDPALRLPVTVRGTAADGRYRSPAVSPSVDGGATRQRLPLVRDVATVPATAGPRGWACARS
ncbi:hypothetical protein ACIRBX_18860 [Kitasatospora sp. NPDC096147]|uniref:hypothetical protein n=1 Tax=Kitasatospora sp. NPDC096147 TaxID=3364093 RepID=UPI0037F77B2E